MADGRTLDRASMPQGTGAPARMEGMVPGVRAGGFLFLSAIRGRRVDGTISADPLEQARQCFANLESVLAASGATLAHVVKVTLYLADLARRQEFHAVWMEVYPADPPARIAICVADANAAPGGGAHYALDVVALAPEFD